MFPVFIKVGPIAITSFGISLALAFLFILFLSYRSIKDRVDITVEELFDRILFISFGVLIGSRVVYILLHQDLFSGDPLAYILFRERPGLSVIGGVLGGLVFFVLGNLRSRRIPWVKIIDSLTYTAIIALICGQLGSFLDGFSFGRATKLPWGVAILGSTVKRHPLPVYYVLFLVVSFIMFKKLQPRLKEAHWAEGTTFLLFASWYMLFSSVFDMFRQEVTTVQSLPVDRVFSLVIVWLCLIGVYKRSRSLKNDIKTSLAFMKRTGQNILHRL